MKFLSKYLKNICKENKFVFLILFFFMLLICLVAVPTLSRYKNRTSIYDDTVWDGSIATSYRSGTGTVDDPYVISNGSELAYFSEQLKTKSYENTYFALNNDIVLNDGIFAYSQSDGIKYTKDGFDNVIVPNEDSDLINKFMHLDGFKGNFDGNSFSIYGLYIDDVVDNKNALFTNLEGNVSNLYVENSIIYGGNITAGVVSDAYNSKLNNILYNGYVIGNSEVVEDVRILNIPDISKVVSSGELADSILIDGFDYINGQIVNVTLSGIYETYNNDAVMKINDELIAVGNFQIDLGTKFNNNIPLLYETSFESSFNLKELKINITYNYGNASGIVSIGDNTELENVINKADVSASVFASGIVNTVNGEVSLNNVYNVGLIDSDYLSSGLISNINQNVGVVTVSNSYNAGTLNALECAMIGNLKNNSGDIVLTNVFNTEDNYAVFLIDSSNVIVSNAFVVYEKYVNNGELFKGSFTLTSIDNLKDKSFVQTNLLFKEFQNSDDIGSNVWIFENDSLPILYIDDLNNPIANIHVSKYTWDNISYELNTLKFSDTFAFNIEGVDDLNPVKEIYYYISTDKEALTKLEVESIDEWKTYENIVNITEEGFYIIYAKIIDYNDNDNVTYLNTDLLVLDLTGSVINISSSLGDNWNSFDVDLDNYYINNEINITIEALDELSGINKVYYYLSDSIMTSDDVEKLDNWNLYKDSFVISSEKNIVYVKVVDNCGYESYANSDLIILNGYSLNKISAGMNSGSVDDMYITNNSKVSLNFTYQDDNNYLAGHEHQLISNVLLPENTKITIIDKVSGKVYSYVTTDLDYGYSVNSVATYSFGLFSQISSDIKFQESDYTGKIDEKFVVVVDFVDAQIIENIEDIIISLKLNNENYKENRNTLVSTLKSFNIIVNSDAGLTFESNFDDVIYYSTDFEYDIDFSVKFNHTLLGQNKVFDTIYEGKNIGLVLKMVDENGNIINSKYLKNLLFKIGDKRYYPSSDGCVRINLEQGVTDIVDNLKIQTFADNSQLKEGNYKLLLGVYIADDGVYSNDILKTIELPVIVGENPIVNNNFDVVMDSVDKIVTTKSNVFNFKILTDVVTDKSTVRVSLYKKEVFSPYNQSYVQIDLGEYISLEKYDDYTYYALKSVSRNNELNLNLDVSLLEKNGYMFVFEFYDDQKLIGKINKKFIVK